MYGHVLRRSVTGIAGKFRLFYSHAAISGHRGCCDSKIHPSLRDEIGVVATPIETQGAFSTQLCCAIGSRVLERVDWEDKR
jgi:hypothetical protein